MLSFLERSVLIACGSGRCDLASRVQEDCEDRRDILEETSGADWPSPVAYGTVLESGCGRRRMIARSSPPPARVQRLSSRGVAAGVAAAHVARVRRTELPGSLR